MRIFRISFHNNGKVYQLHAQQVSHGDLYGFVEIRDLLFDEHTSVVIDPAEERLKSEFAGVQRLMLPLHSVIRIEEVEKRGQNKILEVDGSLGNIMPFPLPPGGGNR
ncbi:MAG: DUF1820 family protein [Chromatiaceae bacterium]|nr:DUF1820 family protein [Gammaproteobacteria bacterium]MCP5306958.1 DUF1820 family protein [Chromatiaceae bacterium]